MKKNIGGVVRAVLVGLFCLTLPAVAAAQASIAGVVRDASGAVLPGVNVEASSPALIEKVRAVVSDGSGQYRIVDLRPGTYTVTFALPGFGTVKREGIELAGSLTATVNADLRVGGVEETITVTGGAPIVDVQGVQQQRVVGKETLDALPTGRSIMNAAVLVPGMIIAGNRGAAQDVGGSLGDVIAGVSIHGGRRGDQRRMVDGMSMQAFATDTSGFTPSQGMIQEVTMDVAAGSAEQGTGGVRINVVPREGGNMFSGSFFAAGSSDALQSDNLDADLRARNLTAANRLSKSWEINPTFGGPIVRDRLWFFVSERSARRDGYVAGVFRNINAGNPASFTYAPDLSDQATKESIWQNVNGRLTWQATSKNKLSLFVDAQDRNTLDTRVLVAPESTTDEPWPWKRLVTATWSAPVTNKVLIDAGYAHKPEDWGWVPSSTYPDETALVGVLDLASGMAYRGPSVLFPANNLRFWSEDMDDSWRASISYVTGAHALKFGYQDHVGSSHNFYNQPIAGNLTYTFNAGVPVQLTQRSPYESRARVHDGGVFAQDRWTIGHLTANVGVRWDFYRTSYPTQTLGPNPFTPNRNITFQGDDLASFDDITPKLGVAYDLFGNGRTAVKASFSKYVEQLSYQGTFGEAAGPVARTVQSVNRQWNDLTFPAGDPRRGNFAPDCDLLNLQPNGECDIVNNLAYGSAIPSTTYDPDLMRGWGKRFYNWEMSASVQHQLMSNVSVDVGYFRRWYGNFRVTDNLNLAPSDFTAFSVVAPTDGRLPDGGGQTIGGLYNITPAAQTRAPDNVLTFADNYGNQIENWHGVDMGATVRIQGGLLVQGGASTGRTLTDNCEVRAALPEIALLNPYCRVETPFLTQVKLLSTYTIPLIDVQVAGTFQSIAGPEIVGNVVYTSAAVQPSLGRPLAGVATVSVNAVPSGTKYGERLKQFDLRVGKNLRFGRVRTALNIDVFNVFNDNTVLSENPSFAVFRQPVDILNPRYLRLSANVDF